MEQPTIWHNPRCSKSKATLLMIEEAGFQPKVFKYLEEEIDQAKLQATLQSLGIKASELLRKKESLIQENQLTIEGASEEQIISYMIKYPKLIERPVVFYKDKAVLGRPPENIYKLFPQPKSK